MYNFTESNENNLQFLKGKKLHQVCHGLYDIQFNFADNLNISVFGKMIFYNKKNEEKVWEVDAGVPTQISVNSLLGEIVSDYRIISHQSLLLQFENSEKIFIDGSSVNFECYTINHQGQIYVI